MKLRVLGAAISVLPMACYPLADRSVRPPSRIILVCDPSQPSCDPTPTTTTTAPPTTTTLPPPTLPGGCYPSIQPSCF